MPLSLRPLAAAIFVVLALPATAAAPEGGGPAVQELPVVPVPGDRASIAPALRAEAADIRARGAASSDTAAALDRIPGISVNQAGGVSGLPAIRGLADDRLRILVDGAEITASCPNHMNPALSYIPPGSIGRALVYPGITPVSVGGDSIGGSIVLETALPAFATAEQGMALSGRIGAFYRSNGDARGGDVAVALATEHLWLQYSGSTARADDYRAGDDFKGTAYTGRAGHTLARDVVGSTGYASHNQGLDMAWASGAHRLQAAFGWQSIPQQGFPNQRMDLTDNRQRRISLRYVGDFERMRLELRGYRETLEHAMDFGPDKRYWYGMASGGMLPPAGSVPCAPIGSTCAAGMPMLADSDTAVLSADAEIALHDADRLRLGLEHRRYRLDDWWPASGGMMWPGTFWNIRDGERDRSAAYVEWEHAIDDDAVLELGLRHERVRSDAGQVQGYNPASDMMASFQRRDAALFNAGDRSRSDGHWDATALLRVAHDARTDLAFGLARKTRSPGLYERYPWSTWTMAAAMNNFVGDGNGYVGNLDLRPERAVTASLTLDRHAPDRRWELRFTPYYTRVSDYIDAEQWDPTRNAPRAVPVTGAFTVLRYLNQDARLYGAELSGQARLGDTALGTLGIEGELAWGRGENTTTGQPLFHQMPPNARLALTWTREGWGGALELTAVDRKHRVSGVRNEVQTAGYGLVGLRLSRQWTRVRVDAGVDNLFDRYYALPTGGAYLGQGNTMTLNPVVPNLPSWGTAVPGPGRSVYAGVTVTF